jgi:hypothetical protein
VRKSWLQEEGEWMRKVILVLCVLIFVLLLLQHNETRMLHVYCIIANMQAFRVSVLVTNNCGSAGGGELISMYYQTKQCQKFHITLINKIAVRICH